MLKQSIYTYLFQRDGHFYIYNSKHSLFAEITEDLYEILYNRDYQSLPAAIIDNLLKKGVVCNESEQYLYYSEQLVRFHAAAYNNKEIGLIIVPTLNCNFDCPYCFEGKKKTSVMTEEVQLSIIEYLKKNDDAKKIHFTW